MVAQDDRIWERLLEARNSETGGVISLSLMAHHQGADTRSWKKLYREAFCNFMLVPLTVDLKQAIPPSRKLSFQVCILGGPACGKKTIKEMVMKSKHAIPSSSSVLVDDFALYFSVSSGMNLPEATFGEPPPNAPPPMADLYLVCFDLLSPVSLDMAKDYLVSLYKPTQFPHMFLVGLKSDKKPSALALALSQQRTAIAYARRFNVSRYCECSALNDGHLQWLCEEATLILSGGWMVTEETPDITAPPPNYVNCSLQ
jgi:hypothetical protein